MASGNEQQTKTHAQMPLDDAIDGVIRDMTRTGADDQAVARVMARVRLASDARGREHAGRELARREPSGREPRATWWPRLPVPRAATPRRAMAPLAMAACAAALIVAIAGAYWLRVPRTAGDRVASPPSATGAQVSAGAPRQPATVRVTPAAPDVPTGAAASASTTQAAQAAQTGQTGRPARAGRRGTQAPSVDAVSATHTVATDGEWRSDLLPPESDIVIARIAPDLLMPPAAMHVEPLRTAPLIVEDIPISTIDMPSVDPRQ